MTGDDTNGLARQSVMERLLAVEEVADFLQISERSVYRLLGRGDLGSVKVGGCTRVEPAELRRFVAEGRREIGPADLGEAT